MTFVGFSTPNLQAYTDERAGEGVATVLVPDRDFDALVRTVAVALAFDPDLRIVIEKRHLPGVVAQAKLHKEVQGVIDEQRLLIVYSRRRRRGRAA